MALLNVLKGSWEGKLGQTVGAKWKNKSTIRSYTKPTDPHSPAQQQQRTSFGRASKFFSLFTDQMKTLSPLDTKGQSVRNALLSLNKAKIAADDDDFATYLVSRGGLPKLTGVSVNYSSSMGRTTVNWTPPTAVNISQKAKVVFVAVSIDDVWALVSTASASAGTLSYAQPVLEPIGSYGYSYLLDYRGSTKVGSVSQHVGIGI